jgi:tetratricopeptide (TPR) repeat protein
LEIDPKNVDVCYCKGIALCYLEKYEEAIECYDKALEIDPRRVDGWLFKGVTFHDSGKNAEAIKCFNKALEIDPSNEVALNRRNLSLNKLPDRKFDEHKKSGWRRFFE